MKNKWRNKVVLGLAVLGIGGILVGCNSKLSDKDIEQSIGQAMPEDLSIQVILNCIKDAYGGSYKPDIEVDRQFIAQELGIEEGEYGDSCLEITLSDDSGDVLMILKNPTEEAMKKLDNYREELIEEQEYYPDNLAKLEESRLIEYRQGSSRYYMLLSLGSSYSSMTGEIGADIDMEKAKEFYKEQMQIGIDALDKLFEVK